MCPLLSAAIRSRRHGQGPCSPQRGTDCQVPPKQFPGAVFETDTAMPNVGLDWDPGPTRKAAASKKDCLNRLSSSQPYPVLLEDPGLIPCLWYYAWLDPHSLLLTGFIHNFSFFLPWGLLQGTMNSLIYCCKTEPPVNTRRKRCPASSISLE